MEASLETKGTHLILTSSNDLSLGIKLDGEGGELHRVLTTHLPVETSPL